MRGDIPTSCSQVLYLWLTHVFFFFFECLTQSALLPGAHPFPGVRTGPADAELFIVPVFCTASLVKRSQRNATLFDVVADLSEAEQLHIIWADMVSQLEYLKPGVANHVLVCPHWYADVTFQSDDYPKPPPELLMGTYSAPNGLVGPGDWPTFVVGCSSYEGMHGLTTGKRRSASGTHSLSPTPAAARRYNVSFIGRWETDVRGPAARIGHIKRVKTHARIVLSFRENQERTSAPTPTGRSRRCADTPGRMFEFLWPTFFLSPTKFSLTRALDFQGWPDWPGELYRRSFKDFVVRTRVRVPPDFYLPMSTAHTSSFFNEQADPFAAWAATEAVMANSLLCLALPGDQARCTAPEGIEKSAAARDIASAPLSCFRLTTHPPSVHHRSHCERV